MASLNSASSWRVVERARLASYWRVERVGHVVWRIVRVVGRDAQVFERIIERVRLLGDFGESLSELRELLDELGELCELGDLLIELG